MIISILLTSLTLLTHAPIADSSLFSKNPTPDASYSETREQLRKTGQAAKKDTRKATEAARERINHTTEAARERINHTKDTIAEKNAALQQRGNIQREALSHLNLNTASAWQLRTAFNIGKTEAGKIILARQKLPEKRFTNFAQLNGIGLSEKTLTRIRTIGILD